MKREHIFFILSLVAFGYYAWFWVTTGIPNINALLWAMFLIFLYRDEVNNG